MQFYLYKKAHIRKKLLCQAAFWNADSWTQDSSHTCIFSTIISACLVSRLNTSRGKCLLHTLNVSKCLFLTFVFKVFNTTIIQLHPFPCNAVFTLSLVHVTLSSWLIFLVNIRDDCQIEAAFISWWMWWTVYNKSFAWWVLTFRDLCSELLNQYSKLFFYHHHFLSGILMTKEFWP